MSQPIDIVAAFDNGWPKSLAALAKVSKFNPPSLQYAKRTAKLIQEAVAIKWGADVPLSKAQLSLALAYGYANFHELQQVFDRDGYKPSDMDDELDWQIVHARHMQHTAAITQVFDIHGKWAYDIAAMVRLTASPKARSASRENDSPWGQVDEEEIIAPGIREVTTGSHGGIILSEEAQAQMPPHLRLDGRAYEEDCCVALVHVGLWQHFAWRQRAYALISLRVLSGELPGVREADDSEYELWMASIRRSNYVLPSKDPNNRQPTHLEVDVVEYLTQCVVRNMEPIVGAGNGQQSLADWCAQLRPIPFGDNPADGYLWPMTTTPWRPNWLSFVT